VEIGANRRRSMRECDPEPSALPVGRISHTLRKRRASFLTSSIASPSKLAPAVKLPTGKESLRRACPPDAEQGAGFQLEPRREPQTQPSPSAKALGASGPVLQRSTATVELEPKPSNLHRASRQRRRPHRALLRTGVVQIVNRIVPKLSRTSASVDALVGSKAIPC
jgi:hypothetical protein